MAIQLSSAVRSARLDAIETTVAGTAKMKIFSNSSTSCAAADPAGALLSMTLPNDWMSAATNGTKGILGGPWTTTASAAGTAVEFRIYANDGTTCGLRGSCATAGGDLSFDNSTLANGQTVSIGTFTLTDGNA